MQRFRWSMLLLVTVLLAVTPLLAGCSKPAPTAVPTQAPASQPTQKPAEPTTVPPTAVPEPQGPTVGGTFVFGVGSEPSTLDPHKTGEAIADTINPYIGGSLIDMDPETGEYIPYLAESWEISEDGLTWDFTIRKGVKFHNGAPLTAKDFAWTYQRAKDPEIKGGAAGQMLGSVESVEAVDDYTLRFQLAEPSFPFMLTLCSPGYLMPLNQEAVEAAGEQYGRHPVGVGPYKFKEWQTGQKVILERNPEFNWGPAYAHEGPWYFDQIEFRIIPEYATLLAGLEAGEIDFLLAVQPKDLQRIKDSGQSQVLELLQPGARPYIAINVTKPPFDDVKVRQAFNWAVDREVMVKTVALGDAIVQYGPISPAVRGYWEGVEEIGYGYDLEKAKALMEEAGYTPGPGGILQKDGQPLKLAMQIAAGSESYAKIAQIAQEQYKALGVEMSIEQVEAGANIQDVVAGNYVISVFGISYPEADILWLMHHSSMEGALNIAHINDPEFDEMLDLTRTTMDPEARQQAVNDVQQYVIEQALMVPLYVPINFAVVNNRVQGVYASNLTSGIYLNDAYIVE